MLPALYCELTWWCNGIREVLSHNIMALLTTRADLLVQRHNVEDNPAGALWVC
jgi:hypothetical protein